MRPRQYYLMPIKNNFPLIKGMHNLVTRTLKEKKIEPDDVAFSI